MEDTTSTLEKIVSLRTMCLSNFTHYALLKFLLWLLLLCFFFQIMFIATWQHLWLYYMWGNLCIMFIKWVSVHSASSSILLQTICWYALIELPFLRPLMFRHIPVFIGTFTIYAQGTMIALFKMLTVYAVPLSHSYVSVKKLEHCQNACFLTILQFFSPNRTFAIICILSNFML